MLLILMVSLFAEFFFSPRFYPRWKEYESKQAESLHFSLDEYQWQRDWAVVLSLASQPGPSFYDLFSALIFFLNPSDWSKTIFIYLQNEDII